MKSVRWYDIFHCCSKYEGICRYIWRKSTERKNMIQYRIINIYDIRTINIINCAEEGASLICKQRAVKKKMRICVNINATLTKWIQISWKLCLKLCSRKSLRPRRSLVRYLIYLQLWQLNILFRDGPINFNKSFFKTLRLAVLRTLRSNLLHSITLDGKNRFLKKSHLV